MGAGGYIGFVVDSRRGAARSASGLADSDLLDRLAQVAGVRSCLLRASSQDARERCGFAQIVVEVPESTTLSSCLPHDLDLSGDISFLFGACEAAMRIWNRMELSPGRFGSWRPCEPVVTLGDHSLEVFPTPNSRPRYMKVSASLRFRGRGWPESLECAATDLLSDPDARRMTEIFRASYPDLVDVVSWA